MVYEIQNDKQESCHFKERTGTEMGGLLVKLRARENSERISVYIKEIIKCNRGNEYMEGSSGVSWRRRWQKGDTLRDEDIEGLELELPN